MRNFLPGATRWIVAAKTARLKKHIAIRFQPADPEDSSGQ
jgi:hypothetical protein